MHTQIDHNNLVINIKVSPSLAKYRINTAQTLYLALNLESLNPPPATRNQTPVPEKEPRDKEKEPNQKMRH